MKEVIFVYANIVRLGNSHALRLPNPVLKSAGLAENDRVEISLQNEVITIRKAARRHRTLEERLTAFYGKPLDQISPIIQEECDWGKPEGEEVK